MENIHVSHWSNKKFRYHMVCNGIIFVLIWKYRHIFGNARGKTYFLWFWTRHLGCFGVVYPGSLISLQWRHNDGDGVSNKSPASRLFTEPFIQGVDQRKHQTSASLAFVRGIHRGPVNSPHKGPVTRKMFPFDDVYMYSTFWIRFPISSGLL